MAINLDLIKEFEGCELSSYRCQAGVLTIGYGHTGPDVGEGMTITQQKADELLQHDAAWVEKAIKHTVNVPLTDGQEAAIASLVFNIGAGAWRSSTALKRLNAGDYAGCAEAMQWWNKADGRVSKGLVRRRETEAKLFNAA